MEKKRVAGGRLAATLAASACDELGKIARLRALRRELIHPVIDADGVRIVRKHRRWSLIKFSRVADAAEWVQRETIGCDSGSLPTSGADFVDGVARAPFRVNERCWRISCVRPVRSRGLIKGRASSM
jgi:hypothetical protein